MKQIIRLTESDLHRLIKESVKQILRENPEMDSIVTDCITALGNYENLDIDEYKKTIQCRGDLYGYEIQYDYSGVYIDPATDSTPSSLMTDKVTFTANKVIAFDLESGEDVMDITTQAKEPVERELPGIIDPTELDEYDGDEYEQSRN